MSLPGTSCKSTSNFFAEAIVLRLGQINAKKVLSSISIRCICRHSNASIGNSVNQVKKYKRADGKRLEA